MSETKNNCTGGLLRSNTWEQLHRKKKNIESDCI